MPTVYNSSASTASAATFTQEHFIGRGIFGVTFGYANCISALIVFMGHRIVEAIRKHIVAQQALSGTYVNVGIDKPTNRRIIISAIEIIETKLGIVVIASVTEGIEIGVGIGSRDVMVGGYAVAPSIVGVGDDLCACRVIDCDNIALKIFLKPESVELSRSH